jgi:hypothetical protein
MIRAPDHFMHTHQRPLAFGGAIEAVFDLLDAFE